MLLVSGLDAVAAREVQAAHDADVLGDVPVHPGHLGVAAGAHQRGVKLFVQFAHLALVGQPLCSAHQPHAFQFFQFGWRQGAGAQAGHAGGFQHHAQVIQLLQAVEVDGPHKPAAFAFHLQPALIAQPKQRFAHGGAADAQALGQIAFAEAVAGHQHKVLQLLFQRGIDLVGQQRSRLGFGCGAGLGSHGSVSWPAPPRASAPRGRRPGGCGWRHRPATGALREGSGRGRRCSG